MARTPEQIVQAEVLCCMSSLVSTIASGYGAAIEHVDAYGRRSTNGSDLANLTEQAFELCSPLDDWEEAAAEAGISVAPHGEGFRYVFPSDDDDDPIVFDTSAEAWRAACEVDGLEPYAREVFEHWAVTDWFADQLLSHGEKVDKDFGGLCVWARTTSGQAIASDYVLEQIAAGLNK